MSRPHSSTLVNTFDAPSHARCTPPSCATESSPYSKNTRSYSCSARAVAAAGAAVVASVVAPGANRGGDGGGETPPPSSTGKRVETPTPLCATNSSRNNRRSDFDEREHRAVEIGEVGGEDLTLLGAELLHRPGDSTPAGARSQRGQPSARNTATVATAAATVASRFTRREASATTRIAPHSGGW